MKNELLKAYVRNVLTLDQYRVLIGLCNHGDEEGAKKGLAKIQRKIKKEKIYDSL